MISGPILVAAPRVVDIRLRPGPDKWVRGHAGDPAIDLELIQVMPPLLSSRGGVGEVPLSVRAELT